MFGFIVWSSICVVGGSVVWELKGEKIKKSIKKYLKEVLD